MKPEDLQIPNHQHVSILLGDLNVNTGLWNARRVSPVLPSPSTTSLAVFSGVGRYIHAGSTPQLAGRLLPTQVIAPVRKRRQLDHEKGREVLQGGSPSNDCADTTPATARRARNLCILSGVKGLRIEIGSSM